MSLFGKLFGCGGPQAEPEVPQQVISRRERHMAEIRNTFTPFGDTPSLKILFEEDKLNSCWLGYHNGEGYHPHANKQERRQGWVYGTSPGNFYDTKVPTYSLKGFINCMNKLPIQQWSQDSKVIHNFTKNFSNEYVACSNISLEVNGKTYYVVFTRHTGMYITDTDGTVKEIGNTNFAMPLLMPEESWERCFYRDLWPAEDGCDRIASFWSGGSGTNQDVWNKCLEELTEIASSNENIQKVEKTELHKQQLLEKQRFLEEQRLAKRRLRKQRIHERALLKAEEEKSQTPPKGKPVVNIVQDPLNKAQSVNATDVSEPEVPTQKTAQPLNNARTNQQENLAFLDSMCNEEHTQLNDSEGETQKIQTGEPDVFGEPGHDDPVIDTEE